MSLFCLYLWCQNQTFATIKKKSFMQDWVPHNYFLGLIRCYNFAYSWKQLYHYCFTYCCTEILSIPIFILHFVSTWKREVYTYTIPTLLHQTRRVTMSHVLLVLLLVFFPKAQWMLTITRSTTVSQRCKSCTTTVCFGVLCRSPIRTVSGRQEQFEGRTSGSLGQGMAQAGGQFRGRRGRNLVSGTHAKIPSLSSPQTILWVSSDLCQQNRRPGGLWR